MTQSNFRQNFCTWFFTVSILITPAAWLTPHEARAHDHNRTDLDNWFRSLGSERSPCCTGEDGDQLKDIDWTIGDTKDCRVTDVGSHNEVGHYCVRIEGIWWLVPDSAVVHMPNRLGPAIVWPVWYGDAENHRTQLHIRCFLPGAGT